MGSYKVSSARVTISLFLVSISAICSSAELAAKPDIVVIVADDLRPDILSIYNGPVPTPNLARLASRGCLFERAVCGYPICHVSRSEMMTGRVLISEAGLGKPIAFDPQWTTWPAHMRASGWYTVHTGKWHVQGEPAQRGYDTTLGLYSSGGARGAANSYPLDANGIPVSGYSGWTFKNEQGETQREMGVGLTPQTDARIADAAIQAIQRRADKPLFLSVNFTAPHDPLHWPAGSVPSLDQSQLALPPNFAPQHAFDHGNAQGRDELIVPPPRSKAQVQAQLAVYYALVANLDTQIGRILDALEQAKLSEQTMVVFTSDQGLALGSHGLMGKQNQYQHTANVPLILTGPDVPAGKRLQTQCSLRDLYPTICHLAGIAIPSSIQGISLASALTDEPIELHPAVFGYFTQSQRMVRLPDGWKLIWYPKAHRKQLFDTRNDPEELHDLSTDPSQMERLHQMSTTLYDWLKQQRDPVIESYDALP